jgi:hypothetical protein
VPLPVTRYESPRDYLWTGVAALAFTAFSAWVGLAWHWAWLAAGFLFLGAVAAFALGLLPDIEIHETHLLVERHFRSGARRIPWTDVARVDKLCGFPLIVRLTFMDRETAVLIYAGDEQGRESLLRNLRRYPREGLIEGAPWRSFWGEPQRPAAKRRAAEPGRTPPPRYPVLLPGDEAEVERLFQQLKTVGRLDPQNKSDEK